jgi:hypothetical protein
MKYTTYEKLNKIMSNFAVFMMIMVVAFLFPLVFRQLFRLFN